MVAQTMGEHDTDLWDENNESKPPLESEPSLRHSLSASKWGDSGSPAESSSNQRTAEVDLDLDTPTVGINRGNSKFQLPRLSPSPALNHAAGNGTAATTPRSSDAERSPRASDSHHPSLTSEKSWNRRVQARSDELRRLFNLPHTEQLMDDFVCALKKKVLLQGRLFVFDSHLCFSSSLFGYHKLKVIPLDHVIAVTKKKNVGFPNSIQIEWDAASSGGGRKKEFFTSFLSREDAYRLIMGLWDHSSDHENAGTEDEDAHSRTGGRHRQDVWSPAGSVGDASERDDATPTHVGGHTPSPFEMDAATMDSQEVSMVLPLRSSIIPGVGVPEFEELPSCENPAVLAAEFDSAKEPAPALPSQMQHVMTCTLPVTPRGFYRGFLCSSSAFFRDFHQAQGHHSIKLSPWQRHFQVGPVRDLRFVTPLKGWRIGPPEALCHQTQRFKVYSGDHLVFETNQAMSDIPYGDHFKVETRWDVTPAPDTPGHCTVDINIAVPFTKNTMWKKFIEKSVTDSSLEAYQMFKELAEGQLAHLRELPGDVGLPGEAGTATGSFGFGTSAGPAATGAAAATALPSVPGHRRMPSRPSTPEELLPTTAEEWEALMSQVAPKWRGGLRSLRKTQMSNGGPSSSSSPVAQGVGVGGPSVARHRRRGSASRGSADMDQLLRSGSGVGGQQSTTRLPRVPEGAPSLAGADIDREKNKAGGVVQRAKQFIVHRWPTFLLCLLCFVIVCLQLALLYAQMHQMRPARGPLAVGDAKAQAAAAKEVAALVSQMQGLERDAAVWRSQLDALMRTASELTDRARQAQRALGR